MVKVRRQSNNPKTNQYDMRVPLIGRREMRMSKEALDLLEMGRYNTCRKSRINNK